MLWGFIAAIVTLLGTFVDRGAPGILFLSGEGRRRRQRIKKPTGKTNSLVVINTIDSLS
jgi:hypothetical protein